MILSIIGIDLSISRVGLHLLLDLPNSRLQETEGSPYSSKILGPCDDHASLYLADTIGLRLASKACFDPNGAPTYVTLAFLPRCLVFVLTMRCSTFFTSLQDVSQTWRNGTQGGCRSRRPISPDASEHRCQDQSTSLYASHFPSFGLSLIHPSSCSSDQKKLESMLPEAYALRASSECGDDAGMMSGMMGAFRDVSTKWGSTFRDEPFADKEEGTQTDEMGWKWVEDPRS